MANVSHLFAWGENNAQLWRRYPHLPANAIIDVTGNPRNDLLRPELHAYYDSEVEKIQKTYGDFILVNTNFNHVNAFTPVQNLFQPIKKPDEIPKFGRAAKGMSREYAEGLRDHKQAIFADFLRLIPALEKSFPEHTIVVRLHPTENHEVYREIAAGCQRVQVTNNVVPWLIAAKALLHNGCTTGVEAYIIRVPAISYRAKVNDYYDDGFYQLPNRLSHQCFDFKELRETLERILPGEQGAADGDERKALIDHHLAARDGPLACERIVDVLTKIADDLSKLPKPPLRDRLKNWFKATKRRVRKRSQSHDTGPHTSLEYQRHKYSGISRDDLRARIARFQQALEDDGEFNVNQIYARLFRISA